MGYTSVLANSNSGKHLNLHKGTSEKCMMLVFLLHECIRRSGGQYNFLWAMWYKSNIS